MLKQLWCVIVAAFLLMPTASALAAEATSKRPLNQAAFQAWLQQMVVPQAQKAGIEPSTLKLLNTLQLTPQVIKQDRNQPEFTTTFWQYYLRALSPARIEKGKQLYQRYQPLVHQVTQKNGVPGRFLIAFWGLETHYGSYTGNTPLLNALATLAYEGRRETFFTRELIAALKVLQNNHFPPSQLKGSWAGAMGQVQFMPSNYLRYGQDGDGDGKVDLWNSMADVFFSAGHFLQQLGWRKGENWGREVKLTSRFKAYAAADGHTLRPLSFWRKAGVTLPNGTALPDAPIKAALYLPMGHNGPAFLLYPNFFVIKKWNNSHLYAVAVGRLADRIAGKPPLAHTPPAHPAPMPRSRLKAIQSHLNQAGYAAGKVDGIFGKQSQNALRQWQKDHGLPADGYPSEAIWWKLNEANRKQH